MNPVLDLTIEDVAARSTRFSAGMEDELHLPPAILDPLHADQDWILAGQPDAKRTEQCVTFLQLLGYLGEGESITQPEIDDAFAAWEGEYAAALEAGLIELTFDAAEQAQLAQIPRKERQLRELKAIATFEGEVTLRELPPEGTTTLASRLVHMRLRSYGLARVAGVNRTQREDRFEARQPFGPVASASIRAGARIFFDDAEADPLELVNLLGSAPAATDAFLAVNGSWSGLYRQEGESGPVAIGRLRVAVHGKRTKRWIARGRRWVFDRKSKPPPRLPSFRTDTAIPDDDLAIYVQHPRTVVGLELLQLRLWMLGYYHGAVDGDWGPSSIEALDRFAIENADLVAGRAVDGGKAGSHAFEDTYHRRGRDGWGLVNLGRILSIIVDELDTAAETLTTARMNEVAELTVDGIRTEEEWQEIETTYARHRERERSHIEAPVVSAAGLFVAKPGNEKRRRYFGWRRFFAAAGAFLRRVGNAIKKAFRTVIDALKSGFGQAFEILRYLWRKARVAVRIARLALRRLTCWLTSTPVTTRSGSAFVATRWSLDFDTIHLVTEHCPEETTALHTRRLDWMSRSLIFMARLAVFVIGLITRAAIAWLLVAYHAYKFVRDMLRDESMRGLFTEDILERGVI